MLPAANTFTLAADLFNPLVPKAHNSEWFPLQVKPVKVS